MRLARLGWRVGLLCAIGLGGAQADEPPFLLWSVAGHQNTVYLLGSVHLLPGDVIEWPAAIEAAYEDAESLVFEIDLDDLEPAALIEVTNELGRLPAGQTLETVLGRDLYADMAEYARQLGLDPARLQPFEPWVAALALAQAQMVALGLSHDAGVEQVFLARALEDRKEVLGLETPQDGLGALANLPLPRQREFIEYTLSEADTVAAELDDMLVAWRRGDTETLARLLEHGFREFPDLYGPLTVERNRRWVAVLDDLLDEPDDYLVVVGALHLVGEESLIDLLEAQGLNVVRR